MKYVLALMLALVMAGQTFADDFIVIVLDTSGSMGEHMNNVEGRPTRIKVAQDAMIEVLSKVPDTTKVGILSFDKWVYDIQQVDRAKLQAAIRNTKPGGGTPLYEYLRAGATRLLEERERMDNKGNFKILVVTDGVANDDALNRDSRFDNGTIRPGVLQDVMQRNVVVDAIGLDMQSDHPLKTIINGSYMAGDDPSSLKQSLRQAVAEVKMDGKDTDADAFSEINDIPDVLIMCALRGLTTFQNHPIGEKPPEKVVRADGTVTTQPDPTNESVPELGEGGGGSVGLVILGLFAGVIALVVLISVMNRR